MLVKAQNLNRSTSTTNPNSKPQILYNSSKHNGKPKPTISLHDTPNNKIPAVHRSPTSIHNTPHQPANLSKNRTSIKRPIPLPDHPISIRQSDMPLLHHATSRDPTGENLHQTHGRWRFYSIRQRRLLSRSEHLLPPYPPCAWILSLHDRRPESRAD